MKEKILSNLYYQSILYESKNIKKSRISVKMFNKKKSSLPNTFFVSSFVAAEIDFPELKRT